MTTEKPALVTAIENELEAIRERLRVCEAALEELKECYGTLTRETPSP